MAIPERTLAVAWPGVLAVVLGACTVFDGKTVPADAGAGPTGAADGAPSGKPVQIASGGERYLALDADSVYFTSASEQAVQRVPKSGGDKVTIVGGQTLPAAIAVDDARVFWASSAPSSVRTCAKSGCASATQLATSGDFPYGLTLDSSTVFWLVSNESGSLEAVGKDGAGAQTLSPKLGYAQWVVADDVAVYFTTAGDGNVIRYDKAQKTSTAIASGESAPHGIAVDGANVYFGTHDGFVKKVPKGGGAPVVVASGQGFVEGLAVDDQSLYWTSAGGGDADGSIQRCAIAGGPVTTLAAGQAKPFAVAVDETTVFWVNSATGAVMKTSK